MATLPPQLDTESSKAYAAFTEYCLLGDGRGLRDVAQKLNKSVTIMGRWSTHFKWVERVKRYDQAVAQELADEHERLAKDQLQKHHDRYGKSGRELHVIASQLLHRLHSEITNVVITPHTLNSITRALEIGAELEAYSMGRTTKRQEITGENGQSLTIRILYDDD